MLPKIPLGRPFGIGVYIHWTWFLLPLWIYFAGRWAAAGDGAAHVSIHYGFHLALLVAVFGCVILHELGHALTARYFGIDTRDITLYPIGGVARLERMSDKPWEEIWIALGGPAVNVVIVALLIVAALVTVGVAGPGVVFSTDVGQFFFIYLLLTNVMLVVFNMLPAFPMDGGRVFRAVLALWLGQLRATRIAATVGIVMAVLIGLLGFFQPVLVVIAGFVVLAGQMERWAVEYRHRSEGEEPIPVLPVRRRPRYADVDLDPNYSAAAVYEPVPDLMFAPRVAVYTWDNEAGVWVPEPGTR